MVWLKPFALTPEPCAIPEPEYAGCAAVLPIFTFSDEPYPTLSVTVCVPLYTLFAPLITISSPLLSPISECNVTVAIPLNLSC